MASDFDYSSLTVGILGSTGSVGVQALDVVRTHSIKLDFLSANKDVQRIEEQVREFHPKAVCMADESSASDLKTRISDTDTTVYSGKDGLTDMIRQSKANTVVNAILGIAGLSPTVATLESGKRCALSNKESLVCAGDIVMPLINQYNGEIIPVDSEHSAIFQAIGKSDKKNVKKILLTASGGPFFGFDKKRLESVTKKDALAHPTWKMGAKITVDSATLMNKGFEVIEAVHLFGVAPKDIEVVVHRESIIHSMVEYIDNTVIAQMAIPDMSLCVQYAITHPHRTESNTPSINFRELSKLTFATPDTTTFPLLDLAYRVIETKCPAPCAMNGANEIAVAAFLNEQISYKTLVDSVIHTTEKYINTPPCSDLDEVFEIDKEARIYTEEFIQRKRA